MSIEVWISFVFAAMLLCFSPGPTTFLIMGQSLSHGRKSAVPLITGVLLGDVISMSLSFAGLGALLSTSALLFSTLKWIAAIYLIYIGIKAWRTKITPESMNKMPKENSKLFKEAFLVTALNPKGIIFFIAFFPLFIDTNKSALPQMLIMAFSFLFVSLVSASFYALFSNYLRSKVRSVSFQKAINKVSGSMLIGAGTITATLQK